MTGTRCDNTWKENYKTSISCWRVTSSPTTEIAKSIRSVNRLCSSINYIIRVNFDVNSTRNEKKLPRRAVKFQFSIGASNYQHHLVSEQDKFRRCFQKKLKWMDSSIKH